MNWKIVGVGFIMGFGIMTIVRILHKRTDLFNTVFSVIQLPWYKKERISEIEKEDSKGTEKH